MSKKAKIIVSISGIVLVMLILVGLTYAYFLTRIHGNTNNKSISVTTANLELTYGDNSAEILGKDLTLIPSDTEIGTKTFTVTNNGNDTNYVVVIENVSVTKASDGSTTTFESNDFRYTLTCTKSDGSNCDGVGTQSIFPINGGVLVGNSIKEGDVHTYTFKMWYIDTGIDQSNDMGKTIQARLNITNIASMTNPYSANPNSLAYNIINNAVTGATGTTLASVSLAPVATSISDYETGKYIYETVSTGSLCSGYEPWKVGDTATAAKSGSYVSSFDEAIGKYVYDDCSGWTKYLVSYNSTASTLTFKIKEILHEQTLSVTQDDLGTSYYYRGNVQDNYLEFNGYCWRIVRIEGDGSIKITLAATKTCSSITSSDTGTAFISEGNYGHTLGKVTNSSGQQSTNDKYVADYVNGTYYSSNSMKNRFEAWLTSSGIDTSKLKEDNWCLGNTIDPYDNNGTLLTSTVNDLMYNSTAFYYDTYVRLYGKGQTANATLRCDGKNYKTHKSYIGTLTADEVVFAGGKAGVENLNYYLVNNAKGNPLYWWTLSPSYFDGSSYDRVFVVYEDGRMDTNSPSGFDDSSLRPAVTLASGTVITGGNGTQTNPYVVG